MEDYKNDFFRSLDMSADKQALIYIQIAYNSIPWHS